MTASKKNPGLSARQFTVSAALAATGQQPDEPAEEPVKGISLRLPLSIYRRVSRLSFDRQQAQAAIKRKRDEADENSIHGILLSALESYLKDANY